MGNLIRLKIEFEGTSNASFAGIPPSHTSCRVQAHMRVTFEPFDVAIKSQVWSWNAVQTMLEFFLGSNTKASPGRSLV